MIKRFIDADDFRKNAYYADTDIDIGVYVAEHGYADVVEVVRCRDCKHYDDGECAYHSEQGRIYERWTVDMNADDYCSYGERRAEE